MGATLVGSQPARAVASGADRAEDTPEHLDTTRRITHYAIVVNPVLAPLGKFGARAEVALGTMHALFVEPSYLTARVDAIHRSLSATEIDIGYHFFPARRGVRGFYVGPRGMIATGGTVEAAGAVYGFGADFGWAWALPSGVALNVGAGAVYYHAAAIARSGAIPGIAMLEPAQRQQIESASIGKTGILPLATCALGVAF